jgi:hypothetical protein
MVNANVPWTWAIKSPQALMVLVSFFMLALSIGRLVKDPPLPGTDQTENWWPVVTSLLNGQGYVSCLPEYFPFCGPGNNTTAMREPVPVFTHAAVAAFSGRSLWAAALFQAGLNILVAWMLFAMGRRLMGLSVGLLAGLLWSIYLPAYQDLNQIAGDQLATVTLVGALYVLVRSWGKAGWKDHAMVGGMLGLAALSRSASMAFIPAIALVHVGGGLRDPQRRTAHFTALLGIFGAFILVLSPWVMRNQQVFGQPIVGSTLSGYNIFRSNYYLDQDVAPHFVASDEGGIALKALLARHPELTGHENEAEMDALYRAEGSAVIMRNPLRYAKAVSFRFMPLWVNWRVNDEYGKPSGPIDITLAALQIMLLLLAIKGMRYAGSWHWPLTLGLLIFCLMHMAVVCRMRYLLPVMPIVALFAAIALDRMIPERWRTRVTASLRDGTT